MTTQLSSARSLRIGVMQFPGSNCDVDCMDALKRHFEISAIPVWHQDGKLPKLDGVVIPGGFSFGDYLRSGALAAHAPIMQDVKQFADQGGAVLGICNGFQILVEGQILPGVLLHNFSQKFICKVVHIKDASGKTLTMPIAHGEGRYWIDELGLSILERKNLIAYQYVNKDGQVDKASNPNGALANIAGIYSENKKVLGMMPHPERATDKVMGGSSDGLLVLKEFLSRI